MMVDIGKGGGGASQARTEAYVPLSPVRIDNDAQFLAAATVYGWPGSGTEVDPFIVSGYEVDATGEANAIYIGNTTVHFTLSSCWLHGDGSYGLLLKHVANASFDSNILSGGSAGASLSFSVDITFANNTFTASPIYGLHLFLCDSMNISENTFEQSAVGIEMISCHGGDILNNGFSNRYDLAIGIHDSTALTLRDNVMDRCGIEMVGQSENSWTSHSIDGSNMVNGMPVFYASNQDGGVVVPGSGQVILGGCSNMSVEGQRFDNTSNAVQAGFSSNLTISNCSFSGDGGAITFAHSSHFLASNNTIADCDHGIKAEYSYDFTVANNTCLRTGYGIYIFDALSFLVDNNSIIDSRWAGIDIGSSTTGTFRSNSQVNNGFLMDGNAIEHWTTHDIDISNTVNGMPVLYASEWHFAVINAAGYGQVIVANTFMARIASADIANATVPILMGFCSECTVSISNCSGSYAGILLKGSSGTVIDSTSIWDNDYGVIVARSDQTRLSNDTIGDCSIAGIYADQSRELDLRVNDMYRCGIWVEGFALEHFGSHSISTDTWVNGKPVYYLRDQVGGTVPENAGEVILANCSDIVVANETTNSATLGIHINFSNNITVSNCTSTNNLDGLEMLRCSNSVIENCSFSDNVYGIVASASSGNEFRDNLVRNSTSWGFYLSSGSSNNLFRNNTFAYNMGSGDVYSPSFIQAYDGGFGNMWNASDGGNYWADWTTPDSNGDGIVDLPYWIEGPASAKDFLPLTDSPQVIPEFTALVPVAAAVALIVLLSGIAGSRSRRRD
jgi:parallel beta-helix repeat protein